MSMTPEEIEAQRQSFAYGNVAIDNPKITRNDIAQAAMKIKAAGRSPNYESLSAEEQWMEDKELGILDWDGK